MVEHKMELHGPFRLPVVRPVETVHAKLHNARIDTAHLVLEFELPLPPADTAALIDHREEKIAERLPPALAVCVCESGLGRGIGKPKMVERGTAALKPVAYL